MDTIRLMLVDDRKEICREMSMAIELASTSALIPIKVIATAHDGFEAIEKADACSPDLILMDLEMPLLGGLSAAKQIKTLHPDTIILAFTIHDSQSTSLAIQQAKMDGLISKGTSLSIIVDEINRCCSMKSHSMNNQKKNTKGN